MKKIAILITLFFIAALVINPFYTPKYQVYHILEKENANSFIEEVQEDDATFILSYYNRHSVCEK
jgi:preprotein translocase subunit SecG